MYTNHISPIAMENQDKFCDALFSLMAQKSFDRITITEICRAAGLERITFYRHFDEKADIIDYYLDRQMMQLMISLPGHSTVEHNWNALFSWAFHERERLSLLMDNRMTTLLSQALGRNIFSVMSANLSEQERKKFSASLYARGDVYLNGAVLGIFCGILTVWRAENFREEPSRLAHRITLLLGLDPGKGSSPAVQAAAQPE